MQLHFEAHSSTLLPITFSIPFSSGDIVMYPFDEYSVTIGLDIESEQFDKADMDLQITTLPLNGFYLYISDQNVTDDRIGEHKFDVLAVRSGVFKVYPIFIIVSFWTLNLIMIAFGSYFIVWGASSVDSGFAMVRTPSP